ncbi:hypothetical protein QE357_004716 [Siphonobacter sp. BAB-5404]|nr:hypothetical protein [Siphonobacter sp. SORGH_AS_0500]
MFWVYLFENFALNLPVKGMKKSVNLVLLLLIILSHTKGWTAHLDTLQVFSPSMKESIQTIGLHYPEQLGALGSMCRAVDFKPYGKDYGIAKILGNKLSDWDAYTVITQASQLATIHQKILID